MRPVRKLSQGPDDGGPKQGSRDQRSGWMREFLKVKSAGQGIEWIWKVIESEVSVITELKAF